VHPQKPDSTSTRELQRLAAVKHIHNPGPGRLGPAMIEFFKKSVQKRHTKLSKVAEVWGRLVPETLIEHSSLEGFSSGTLTVLVDTASHLYELKQLLLAGLQDQLLLACRASGLRKIILKRGQWYDGDAGADRKIRFDK